MCVCLSALQIVHACGPPPACRSCSSASSTKNPAAAPSHAVHATSAMLAATAAAICTTAAADAREGAHPKYFPAMAATCQHRSGTVHVQCSQYARLCALQLSLHLHDAISLRAHIYMQTQSILQSCSMPVAGYDQTCTCRLLMPSRLVLHITHDGVRLVLHTCLMAADACMHLRICIPFCGDACSTHLQLFRM